MSKATTTRIDLWFNVATKRGCRTYHRTISRISALDELKAKLAKRANLRWFAVDCAEMDHIHIDIPA